VVLCVCVFRQLEEDMEMEMLLSDDFVRPRLADNSYCKCLQQ